MKERPIIFNAEMVNAILDGRKTQTRRVIAPSMRTADAQFELHQNADGSWQPKHLFNESCFDKNGSEQLIKCPFGEIGDRLWVRETARCEVSRGDFTNNIHQTLVAYRADGNVQTFESESPNTWFPDRTNLKASGELAWCPSIHMPRWASRITLEITGVRVERLNSISEEDAKAEGVPPAGDMLPDYPGTFLTPKGDFATAKVAFQRIWESIYGAESWQANPWVWVIEFKRVAGGVK